MTYNVGKGPVACGAILDHFGPYNKPLLGCSNIKQTLQGQKIQRNIKEREESRGIWMLPTAICVLSNSWTAG